MFERKGEFNFVLIGAKSTGKTWYIKHLAKREGITALDDNTIKYIDIISEQDKGTSISYTELFFNYKDETYNIEFQIDDYDGNFVETWHQHEENSEYKEKLTEYVKESEGIFIFLPYENESDAVRFDRMQKETDVFISKIKEEYGEEHSELPIPVIIVVSKWDQSPDYGKKNEFEKAKEYIASNKTLNLIKNKIQTHFKHIDVIPLSSAEDYNIELPIRMCLDSTFKSWEEKIESLTENKKELLIFLKSILYDIRFYKDGKYKKLYDEIEAEIAEKYLNEIKRLKNTDEFDNYYNKAYKSTRETSDGLVEFNILEALNERHIAEIEKIQQDLSKKKNFKRMAIGSFVVIVLVLAIFGFMKHTHYQSEKKLYSDIQTEYKNKNLTTAMDHIQIYYADYNGINKEHYEKLKLLEEKIKAQYRAMIDNELKNLSNNKSVLKSYEIMKEIHSKAKKYNVPVVKLEMIDNEFYRLENLKEAYGAAITAIDQLSLDSINKDKVDDILQKKNLLTGFVETQTVQDNLNKKIQSIINTSLKSDNEDLINKMIEFSSIVGVQNSMIKKLHNRLKNVKLRQEFNLYLESLDSIDNDKISDLISETSLNWKSEYGEEEKSKVRNILSVKYNIWVEQKLKDLPEKISNVDAYNRIVDFLKENKIVLDNLNRLPLHTETIANKDNAEKILEKINLYNRYNTIFKNGITTTKFIFFAKKGNGLGITASDDEVNIYIDGILTYNDTDSQGYINGKMSFTKMKIYKIKKYTLKIVEKDIAMSDDRISGSFSISANQLIELENEGHIFIDLGDIYDIEIWK